MQSSQFSQSKLEQAILIAILCCGAYLAYSRNFLQDDAYISFRYAKHFAQGYGLVWYPGSDEYGYTNFLFTLLIGLMMKAGLGPEMASYLISIPSYFGIILLTYSIGRLIFSSMVPTLLACLGVATNHTMAAYATGGLETSFQLCLIMGVYYCVLCWHFSQHQKFLKRTACLATLALLTRLDSALLLFPAYAFMALRLADDYRKQIISFSAMAYQLVFAAIIPSLAVCLLLTFCHLYYNGHAMPTSFYAKLNNQWYIMNGFNYVYAFIKAQMYAPLLLMGLWFLMVSEKDFTWQSWRYRLLLLACIAIWLLYVLHVGGDFMEFRFVLPMLPFFYLLILDLILDKSKNHYLPMTVLLAALILFGNYIQPYYFQSRMMDKNLIESTGLLNKWVVGRPYNWSRTGKILRKLFYTGSPDDIKIAVTGAGIIPYYSDLFAIDQHGLNTRKVIEIGGTEYLPRPGHRVKARPNFLEKQGVNLIIDHPIFVKKKDDKFICLATSIMITHESLIKIPVIFIPLEGPYYLLAHYLVPHGRIDAMIARGEIIQHKDVMDSTKCGRKLEIPAEEPVKSP